MKRILLTYGYHKSGHYSAVRALEEELESRGADTEICNLWEGKAETIDRLFTIFRAFAAKGVKKVPDFLIAPELLELFAEEIPFDKDLHAYDGVISTHQYSSSLVATHKQKQGSDVPLVHVHTDYTPFPLRVHPLIDFFTGATPREDADTQLHERLVATGIPVRKAFRYDGKPLPPHQVLGFIDDLSSYFNRAEFVITKGGGLTVAEALNCECIPIFPPPILSWEDDAARYLCAQGAGVCIPKLDKTGIKAMNALFASEGYKEALRERGRVLAKPNAVKDIVNLLERPKRKIAPSEQARMVKEMRAYHSGFASAHDLPKLTRYITEQINEWLDKHEPNNRN